MLAILYLFVYQVLRTFNMLTKSKISEARCSDVEDIVTMLSNEVAIHFVYQTLCVFNMLTKSKISEARFQVRRTCNHVEHLRCDTYSWFRTDRFVTMLSTVGAIHSCFQISKKFVNMLSIEDAIHKLTILYLSWFRC